MVFSNKDWIVNNTYTHQFFVSGNTGQRLKPVAAITVPDGSSSWTWDTLGYKITRQPYTYTFPSKVKGTYTYQAIQFTVQNTISGKQVVLRSRGTGNGTLYSYFDIYIEDESTSGSTTTVTAIRNDPKWFTYPGTTIELALSRTDTVQNLTGSFPSFRGWYFLDIGGGGDLGPAGTGRSFIFKTDSLRSKSKTADIGSSYPVDFALRWMDAAGNVKEFRFLPKLLSETWSPPVGTSDETMAGFSLMNYPNPFARSTTIRYQLPEAGNVRLVLYNAMGQEAAIIHEGEQQAGIYTVPISAAKLHLKPGIYFYLLQAGDRILCEKMICR